MEDPFSKRPISSRDAAAVITDYKRSTSDLVGTVDLMLTFVEAGTEQAADLGYGDDAYFNALASRLMTWVKVFDALPETARHSTLAPRTHSEPGAALWLGIRRCRRRHGRHTDTARCAGDAVTQQPALTG